MPAYNFKDQFVPAIRAGRKTTTIRQIRKQRPTRIGDRLYLFNRMRQSRCRLVKDTECVKLTPIVINGEGLQIWLAGKLLSSAEAIRLAQADGFDGATEFFQFFSDNYGAAFEGELIEWRRV